MTPTLSGEISVYKGELTESCIVIQTGKIFQAFPKMDIETYDLLKERFKANNFNDERLVASVAHVIDSYEGWDKVPNIANFIQYDKTVKIYTYEEAIKFGMRDLTSIRIGELVNPRWCLTEHVEKYKLTKWGKT